MVVLLLLLLVVVVVVAVVVLAVVAAAAPSLVQNRHKTSCLNQGHTINLRICTNHLFLAGAACSGAGERSYFVPEMVRAGYLFCFVRQSAVAVVVQVTRSWPT